MNEQEAERKEMERLTQECNYPGIRREDAKEIKPERQTPKEETESYFYHISKDYLFCDKDNCSDGERTFDLPFNELATNEPLLDKLNLICLYPRNKAEQIRFFATYIADFNNDRSKGGSMLERLKTNPTVRLLVMDKELLKAVKEILK